MSIFEELLSLAGKQNAKADEFYRIASSFPQRLLAVTETYLQSPVGALRLVTPDLREKAWNWKDWSGQMSGSDLDDEGFFRVAISIELSRVGNIIGTKTLIIPAFGFRPVHGGVSAHMLRRGRDGRFERQETILTTNDDNSFEKLLDQCLGLCKEYFAYDPFTSNEISSRIGF